MPQPHSHTSPSCRLRPLSHYSSHDDDDDDDGVPRIATQFFYSSPIPIDDPLSAAIATIPDANNPSSAVQNLRPFSEGDNLSLERAWLQFSNPGSREQHQRQVRRYKVNKKLDDEVDIRKRLEGVVERLAKLHVDKHKRESVASGNDGLLSPNMVVMTEDGGLEEEKVVCCQELGIDIAGELRKEFCGLVRRRMSWLSQERVTEGAMNIITKLQGGQDSQDGGNNKKGTGGGGSRPETPVPQMVVGSVPRVPGMSGIGVGEDMLRGMVGERDRDRDREGNNRGSGIATPNDRGENRVSGRRRGDSTAGRGPRIPGGGAPGKGVAPPPEEDTAEVPVGIQRLHMVSLPVLQMKPIYWSPVNDIATVVRATWFYRDTMVPLPPLIANQLEAGYRELRPWTETWSDELRSALDVGAVGEEKVTHRLWPEPLPEKQARASKSKDGGLLPPEPAISSDPFCAARCFSGEAAAEGKLEPVHEETDTAMPAPEQRQYGNYHVVYKNAKEAFLLKPSQQPSAYYSRRPVQKIMKGVTVGVPVVRGFDRHAWERVHEGKKGQQQVKQQTMRQGQRGNGEGICLGCQEEMEKGQVTDLVLIAHGIGQKFAERVESFHFTHAVNAFRRMVNVELETPAVKSVLRPEQNGIMVLPVNWRHLLSFEDGGPTTGNEEDKAAYAPDGFGLKDIEPGTIPAVRSMISDVMFDIPFYMSHHKPKMIAALVGEANRVYRLWCGNNPGFAERGRVHLIGHSLGSAMAVEVLSKQPTRVPRPLDVGVGVVPDTKFFEFDTTNLFLLGSPAAFFLLLERGGLVPRRGRMKPGAEAADTVAKDVVGELGMFGCIAVDNIYNILAKEDPIAYLLNGTIDPVYAASLKTAYVPSFSTGVFKSMGDALRGMAGVKPSSSSGGGTTTTTLTGAGVGDQQKKPSMMMRLPSQLELEVHDFTREDVAEKKAFLLNDNGQIDYYLKSGGGPLEIQYLNMLSAHTSYWTNLDLIRFLCIEVGRRLGRENTLPAMRAVKVKGRFGGVQVGSGSG
ncbi:putative phospholipase [Triangularia setosa]|uniref:Phospholipase n=1 Tax=Triangularia setosa TaxID=2587417 RepID=A0AAN6WB24_9PEZI|nr:putative phospholipase [Podospora setosa]